MLSPPKSWELIVPPLFSAEQLLLAPWNHLCRILLARIHILTLSSCAHSPQPQLILQCTRDSALPRSSPSSAWVPKNYLLQSNHTHLYTEAFLICIV